MRKIESLQQMRRLTLTEAQLFRLSLYFSDIPITSSISSLFLSFWFLLLCLFTVYFCQKTISIMMIQWHYALDLLHLPSSREKNKWNLPVLCFLPTHGGAEYPKPELYAISLSLSCLLSRLHILFLHHFEVKIFFSHLNICWRFRLLINYFLSSFSSKLMVLLKVNIWGTEVLEKAVRVSLNSPSPILTRLTEDKFESVDQKCLHKPISLFLPG